MNYKLRITFISDTTFGRGDGIAGLVDVEIEHDTNGLPEIRGRTLKGLLTEECANVLFQAGAADGDALCDTAALLFGRGGSTLDSDGLARFGPAQLLPDLRAVIAHEVATGRVRADQVLASLTAVRRQTSIDVTGVPARGSLRSSRVALRDLSLYADIEILDRQNLDSTHARALLGSCAASLRRGGLGRNRGRGRLACALIDTAGNDLTQDAIREFMAVALNHDARHQRQQEART
jgi:hypothetical protein